MSIIKHEYTDNIICPYCGYKLNYNSVYESVEEKKRLIECDECNEYFYATRYVEISYCTQKVDYGTCSECNTENVIVEDYEGYIGSYNDLCLKCKTKKKTELNYQWYYNNK